ncbi:hypothetical protein [Kitasatospora sp. NPDC006786]|uniref:hypothetical protein n=1 Tax=unclassified Kitasatospora TaxID=2633591 RepID=UPI0033D1FBEB
MNTLRDLITTGLNQHGIATTCGSHASAGVSWVAVDLPDGTFVWSTDEHASIDNDAAKIGGLHAIHYLGDPNEALPQEQITLVDRRLDRRSNRTKAITELVDTIATYVTDWPNSPVARHPERRIGAYGVMDLPARLLRRGDVIVHTATGHESVITNIRHLGRGEYRRTARTVTPPTRGSMIALPDTWWKFPNTLSHSGSTVVPVAAYRHVDPDTLPKIPYPAVPTAFADGDHVVHDKVIWERANGTWTNHTHTRHTPPSTDETIIRLFTEPAFLRQGIPTHQPAA